MLYVPDLSVNLIFIGTSAKNGVDVIFNGNYCTFKRRDRTIVTGCISNDCGLFKLNITPSKCVALLTKTRRTLEEWHNVLAHVNHKEIERMANEGIVEDMIIEKSVSKTIPCPDCPRGKATHTTHPISRREKARVL